MPRYLAPQATNWMLHRGPSPKQTMSGGFGGGVWLAGAASGGGAKGLVVVVCATAEAMADKKSRIAIPRARACPMKTSRRMNRLRKAHAKSTGKFMHRDPELDEGAGAPLAKRWGPGRRILRL